MKNKKKVKKVRLSKEVLPVEYDIKLHPDLENFTFNGEEKITLNLLKPTKVLTLHSKDIEIDTAYVEIKKQKVFAQTSYNTEAETVTFKFTTFISKGKVNLFINFKGILNDKMRGFYRSSYVLDGKVHNLATTQFEATDARRAFPCFDEPAHKAVFHVSLVVPKGQSAISNTLPISRIEHESGFEVVKFSPTPKMSTYLLAFIVGNFEYIEKKSKNGVLVRVYTTPGKRHQADFALDVTAKVLDFYEEYFDIPYPLNTLDMIAIPDFSSLAMENWGAVTFREIGLLLDENTTSTSSKEMIVEVIAHELAHQWFGNLVTMEWWTHLWLNEGFASYVPYIVMDKLFPEWDVWERFVTGSHGVGVAMRLDALANTHPIEVEVHHPSEIGEIFDAVSYSKGASVIRMLADYLGEEAFRDGLRYYLKKHSYKNTETIHLWEAFEKISKKPVSKIMKVWTGKSGYPVVKIHQKKGFFTLEQNRFFSSAVSKNKSKDKTVWPIPVSTLSDRGTETFLMDKKKMNYENSTDSWIKINRNETAFFRSAYSHELLLRLKDPVLNKELNSVDRLGIVRDLFASAESGDIPTDYVLEFLESYKNEDELIVWTEIITGINKIKQLLTKSPQLEKLNKLIQTVLKPTYDRLGWDKVKNEKHSDTLLRPIVISSLGRAGNTHILKEAKNKFNNIKKGKKVDPDLRGVVYSLIATGGSSKEYKDFIKMYKSAVLHEEKNRIGYALTDFKDTKILSEVIEFAFSKEVRTQDTNSILHNVGLNPKGRDIWLKSMTKNWKVLVERYGGGNASLANCVKGIGRTTEEKHLKTYRDFFKKNKAPGAERAVEQTIEMMESNIAWLKRDKKKIEDFLKKI